MDKYSITGSELSAHYKPETPLAIIFRDIEKDLSESQQVVCRFVVNGIELSEHEELKLAQAELREVKTLEFWADQPFNLMLDVTQGWIETMPEMIQNTEALCHQLRTVRESAPIKPFYDLVENCEFIVGSLISIQSLGGDHFQDQHATWQETSEHLRTHLLAGYEAVEKKDFVTLADILEYELIPCFEMWQKSLINVRKRLQENRDEFKQKLNFTEKPSSGPMVWQVRPQ